MLLRYCLHRFPRNLRSASSAVLVVPRQGTTAFNSYKLSFPTSSICRAYRTTACTMSTQAGILKSKYPDVDIPTDLSLNQYVLGDFAKRGDAVALVDGFTERSYTFNQLNTFVHNCGSGLARAGYRQGDVCALFSPNIPEFFIAYYAVAAIGGVVTTVNPLYTADELASQLQASGAKALITIPQFLDKAKEAAAMSPSIQDIYVFGTDSVEGCTSFAKLMTDDGSAFPSNVTVNPTEDVVALPFSSGTTGPPKGVMLTHYNIISNIAQLSTPGFFKYTSGVDTILGLVPFFHIYGMVLLANVMSQGVKAVTLSQFDAEHFLKTIQEHKVTIAPVVPPIVLFLAKHPLVDKYDLTSLNEILSGAAPLGAELQHAVKSRLDDDTLICRQGFGLTELSPVVNLVNTSEPHSVGSVGHLVPNTQAKVVDAQTGEILGEGENGELCYRGPQMMKGYLNNEEATAATIRDGWLHTGDIGHYDSSGQFYIVDRLKELIKYKGFQVAPAELEALLLSHPDVQDAAVIGVPDDVAGELPKAFIVPKSKQVSADEIVEFVAGKVSPHKKLRGGIEFVDEIPKTAAGKILRKILKDQEVEKMKSRV